MKRTITLYEDNFDIKYLKSPMNLKTAGIAIELSKIANVFILDANNVYKIVEKNILPDKRKHIDVFNSSDIIITHYFSNFSYKVHSNQLLGFQILAQFCFEFLYSSGEFRDFIWREYLQKFRNALKLGDFFICDNERQRDMLLGSLYTLKQHDFRLFSDQGDVSLNGLVQVVPWRSNKLAITPNCKQIPLMGICENDFVLLWGGGIWEWFDPLTIVKAVKRIIANGFSNLKVIMCSKYVEREESKEKKYMEVYNYCKKNKLLNSVVKFSGWLSYKDYEKLLSVSNVGITAAYDGLENHFAARIRVLEYLRAGLPMIVTKGDVFSDVVKEKQLGEIVAAEDVEGWVNAITNLMINQKLYKSIRENVKKYHLEMSWEKSVSQVVNLIENFDNLIEIKKNKLNNNNNNNNKIDKINELKKLFLSMNHLAATFKDKKIAFYGAGTVAQTLYPLLKNQCNIVVDREQLLHGTILGNNSIFPVEKLLNSISEIDKILITPLGRKSGIKNYLFNLFGKDIEQKLVFVEDFIAME